ncbi:hypothetical protein GCM10029992_35360 [Glycomyces albus]
MGRLDLFRAADGYGRFDGDVRVVMEADRGGFHRADAWRNDIGGGGKLHKVGSGALALSGDNSFTGGVHVESGTLEAASATALGGGEVQVKGGALVLEAARVEIGGKYTQAGAALDATVNDSGEPVLDVEREFRIETGSVLRIHLDPQRPPAAGVEVPIVKAKRVEGEFDSVELDLEGRTATTEYGKKSITVRIDLGFETWVG